MQNATSELIPMHAGYPLFVDLQDRPVTIIGGGGIAQHKLITLLSYGAQVTVISPEVTPLIREYAESKRIVWIARNYEAGDLSGASIAFSACGDPVVDQEIHREAKMRNCLLNVVDVPQECDFIVPSIVNRGLLQIAVSTSGAACTEAKRIRKRLETEFDESWEDYLVLMSHVRALVKERVAGGHCVRKPIFEAAASAGWRERLAAGEIISVEQAYEEALSGAGYESQPMDDPAISPTHDAFVSSDSCQ